MIFVSAWAQSSKCLMWVTLSSPLLTKISLTAKTTDDYGPHIIITLPKTIDLCVVYIFHSMQLLVLFQTDSSSLYLAHPFSLSSQLMLFMALIPLLFFPTNKNLKVDVQIAVQCFSGYWQWASVSLFWVTCHEPTRSGVSTWTHEDLQTRHWQLLL